VFAAYVPWARTALRVQTYAQTALSENTLLPRVLLFALIALLESTLEIRVESALTVLRVNTRTLQELKLAIAVRKDRFLVTWERLRVPFALQDFMQLAMIIPYVLGVQLVRLTLYLVLVAAAHVQPENTLETT